MSVSLETFKPYKRQRVCGVYALLKNGKAIYVGRSINLESRLAEHSLHKNHDSVLFRECSVEESKTVERELIQELRPKQNVVHNPNCAARKKSETACYRLTVRLSWEQYEKLVKIANRVGVGGAIPTVALAMRWLIEKEEA